MYSSGTGQRPVATVDICLVSAEDICLVSTADICPVSTADIWRLWGHLGEDENDFDSFFFIKNAQNGTQMTELMEPVEPRKRRHGPLRGTSFYTRRGLGLREFSKQTPSN